MRPHLRTVTNILAAFLISTGVAVAVDPTPAPAQRIFACEGKRIELGPGDFNFMPARMVHEAWLPEGSLTFITVDGAWDVNRVEGPPTAADVTKVIPRPNARDLWASNENRDSGRDGAGRDALGARLPA